MVTVVLTVVENTEVAWLVEVAPSVTNTDLIVVEVTVACEPFAPAVIVLVVVLVRGASKPSILEQ